MQKQFPLTRAAWDRFTDAFLMLWHHGSFPLREVTYAMIGALVAGLVLGICIGRMI